MSRSAHIVLAHPEPLSYNAHLAELARATSAAEGWSVMLCDLYAMGFDPCERAEHYAPRRDPGRFDVQAEQHHASTGGAIPGIVRDEIERLDQADLLVLQYPMWWHLPPAMLKGWMDRVFIYGEVYASQRRFEKGRFAGKRAMLSVTVATSADTYSHNGRSGDIDLLLWPVQFSLAYVGYAVIAPFIAYGVEAGLEGVAADFRQSLKDIDRRPPIPFNRMAEWQPSGRIAGDAPVYSPFIRHRQELDLG